jgi:hypothetical protein
MPEMLALSSIDIRQINVEVSVIRPPFTFMSWLTVTLYFIIEFHLAREGCHICSRWYPGFSSPSSGALHTVRIVV